MSAHIAIAEICTNTDDWESSCNMNRVRLLARICTGYIRVFACSMACDFYTSLDPTVKHAVCGNTSSYPTRIIRQCGLTPNLAVYSGPDPVPAQPIPVSFPVLTRRTNVRHISQISTTKGKSIVSTLHPLRGSSTCFSTWKPNSPLTGAGIRTHPSSSVPTVCFGTRFILHPWILMFPTPPSRLWSRHCTLSTCTVPVSRGGHCFELDRKQWTSGTQSQIKVMKRDRGTSFRPPMFIDIEVAVSVTALRYDGAPPSSVHYTRKLWIGRKAPLSTKASLSHFNHASHTSTTDIRATATLVVPTKRAIGIPGFSYSP
ncbi:hypothetical protein DFJ77DRAFT_107295 [Powellomyces hirtus]|nr:hypothetical protein DFJ77DRAFT_107295 [Powellomyces hirtus]